MNGTLFPPAGWAGGQVFRYYLTLWITLIGVTAARAAEADTTLERRLIAAGLVDVQQLDSTIVVELKYADTSNFMRRNVYGGLRRCYLRREAARKLVQASAFLRTHHPGVRLLVADGLRPRGVQRTMWEMVKGTPMQRYVADPRWGSMHNYGCAVDVTLVDSAGERLDMGTPLDYFGPLAQPRLEQRYLRSGKLSAEQLANRRVLRGAMKAAGFHPIGIEWWHFNAFEKPYIREHFTIVE
jgi:D-alanyl-D-alanine dipeptidase